MQNDVIGLLQDVLKNKNNWEKILSTAILNVKNNNKIINQYIATTDIPF